MPDRTIVTLADIAHAEMDANTVGAVSDPLPQHVRDAIRELTDAIVETGVDQRDAEYAVTRWMIQSDLSIEQCVELEQNDEARAMRKPEGDTG